MRLRDEQDHPGVLLRKREPNFLGVRCAESQADGVPCPHPDCDCEHCARAYARVTFDLAPPRKDSHA